MPEHDPWEHWTAEQIAEASGCPQAAVEANWPHVQYALAELGIADVPTCAAVIGTIAIETAGTFAPVREAFWLDEDWRRANLRYWPYYGRGYIQLTWASNYSAYGRLLGQDLVNSPDLALDPSVAAWVLAHYARDHGIPDLARAGDLAGVRRAVLGASTGYERLVDVAARLGDGKQVDPAPAPSGLEVWINGVSYLGDDGGDALARQAAALRAQADELDHWAHELQRVRTELAGARP